MRQTDFVFMLHSHLPYVLNHGRWPHGSDWICEAAIETYLPLLEALQQLDERNVAAPVTIGFTPVLANMLEHPVFAAELDAYFAQRFEFCDEAPASMTGTADEHMLPLVAYWRDRLVRMQGLWQGIDKDILRAFRALQDKGRLEITSSAATHGFLPLLARDESIRLQLVLGRSEHVRIFGREPNGCWVPECAYRPAGPWAPRRQSLPTQRRGIDEHLADTGYDYFFTDSHMARAGKPLGTYGRMFAGEAERMSDATPDDYSPGEYTPYRAYRVSGSAATRDVAAFVRDPRSSARVWNRHGGYPGDGSYLEFHKIRWPGGLRLWRVTSRTSELGDKLPYEPAAARATASTHAKDFATQLSILAEGAASDAGAVITAPFDTELFGHWWFEGPDFLADLYAALPRHIRIRPTTASAHLERYGSPFGLELASGTWGKNGDYSMWMNKDVEWTWPIIWDLEERFWFMASPALERPDLHPVLAQAARSLLLLQSSDWQFIISTGEVEDYSIKRFTGHANDATELLNLLSGALEGGDVSAAVARAGELQNRDDVFRTIIPSIAAALQLSVPG